MPAETERSERLAATLLLALAVGAGVVDAISLTTLDVFTAAVTANVVLVGIALGDVDPHTAFRAAVAIGGFAVGVAAAAWALAPARSRPAGVRSLLAAIAAVQLAFLGGWLAADGQPVGAALDLLAAASGIAMGGQTAAAARLKSGIPPTYVSGVLTTALSDLAMPGQPRRDQALRIAVIAAVVTGAAIGAFALADARDAAAALPLAITVLVALAARHTRLTRRRG